MKGFITEAIQLDDLRVNLPSMYVRKPNYRRNYIKTHRLLKKRSLRQTGRFKAPFLLSIGNFIIRLFPGIECTHPQECCRYFTISIDGDA